MKRPLPIKKPLILLILQKGFKMLFKRKIEHFLALLLIIYVVYVPAKIQISFYEMESICQFDKIFSLNRNSDFWEEKSSTILRQIIIYCSLRSIIAIMRRLAELSLHNDCFGHPISYVQTNRHPFEIPSISKMLVRHNIGVGCIVTFTRVIHYYALEAMVILCYTKVVLV